MKTTKEYTKSDRPLSGFYNVLLQRIYQKVDGIDVNKIDRVIEVVTISQLKDLAVDVSKYNIKNTDGLAGRFENTRNYIFPVSAMEKILDAGDHAVFIANYNSAVKTLEKEIKQNSAVHKAVMDAIAPTVKTEAPKEDPIKKAISDVIPLNAAKTEKAEKVQDPVPVKSEKAPAKTEVKKVVKAEEKTVKAPDPVSEVKAVAPVKPVTKTEEKKQDVKPAEELTVSKSVTIDAGYIDKLIAAAPVAKKSKAKKSIKKSDLEQIAALF